MYTYLRLREIANNNTAVNCDREKALLSYCVERKETHSTKTTTIRINRKPNELSALKITIYISGSAIYGRHSVANQVSQREQLIELHSTRDQLLSK